MIQKRSEDGARSALACAACGERLEPDAGVCSRCGAPTGRPGVADLVAGADAPEAAAEHADTVAEHDTVVPRDGDGGVAAEDAGAWAEGAFVADRFRVSGFIGQGGMGKVYVAQDETLDRPVALKRIPQEILFDIDARDDLRQEANRLLDLAHENIVRIHTYYDGPTWPFFAMEYLRGPTLKKLLRDRKQAGRAFNPDEVRIIARQVGRGLEHAHDRSVVHRDLKPANLMLAAPVADGIDASCVVKITDFGISRVVADSTLRHTGKRSGTLPYMSPEQYLGEASNAQSDIYSFACTLYELLTGKAPFSSGDIGYQILNVVPKRLPRGEVPRAMADAIERGLAKNPSHRFATVREFVDAIDGKLPAARPGFTTALVALGSKMALGALLIVLLVAIAKSLWPDAPPSSTDGSSAARIRVPRHSAEELERASAYLKREFQRQIGVGFGRPKDFHESAIAASISLSVDSTGLSEEAVRELRLYHHRLDLPINHWEPAPRPRAAGDGLEWIVDLGLLREGQYEIKSYLQGEGETTTDLQATHTFRVDLTLPVFELRFADSTRLVDEIRPATFDDRIEMRLIPSPADRGYFEEVKYRVEGGGAPAGEIPVVDRERWQWTVPLPEPGDYRIDVIVTDKTKNTSAPVAMRVLRRRLEVRGISVAKFRGPSVEVAGDLLCEGGYFPNLEFAVNDQWISHRDLSAPSPASGANPADDTFALRPFLVSLPLDQVGSSIKVGYRLAAETPRPLSPPVELSQAQVTMPAPEIILDPFAGSARSAEVTLTGTVDPYFAGLQLRVQGNRSLEVVELSAGANGATARFETRVLLQENVVNVITFTPSFRKTDMVEPPPPRIEIRQDNLVPMCTEVSLLASGEVEVEVSEPLAVLRARWAGAEEPDGRAFSEPALDRVLDVTRIAYRFPPPGIVRRGALIELVLVDLADNTNTLRRSVLGATDPVASVGSGSPAATGAAQAIALVPRSEFLRAHDIRFLDARSRGESFQLMMTEVPHSLWKRFLEAQGTASVLERPAGTPMALGDRPVSTAEEFVHWFETQADDGWRYSIPTFEQWLCAFADVEDLAEAENAVRAWFQIVFKPEPEQRYGVNRVLPIGSRRINASPAGFLDMESNLQELVRVADVDTIWAVIGGRNHERPGDIVTACIRWRKYDSDRKEIQGPMTGLRLARQPKDGRAR